MHHSLTNRQITAETAGRERARGVEALPVGAGGRGEDARPAVGGSGPVGVGAPTDGRVQVGGSHRLSPQLRHHVSVIRTSVGLVRREGGVGAVFPVYRIVRTRERIAEICGRRGQKKRI